MTQYYVAHIAGARKAPADCRLSADMERLVSRGKVFKIGRDVFTNVTEATARSRALRAARIASLRRQIARLEALS